jgi:hypothetical protein
MRLLDHVAQCRVALVAEGPSAPRRTRLSGAAEHAAQVAQCALRYVLTDELTRLCAALAYSKGARALQCVDLIRVPAERVWIEWSREPWIEELKGFGFRCQNDHAGIGRCRGALIAASRDGRRGTIHTFWDSTDARLDVYASSMLAHFDLDGLPGPPEVGSDRCSHSWLTPMGAVRVSGGGDPEHDLISRCFRFQFEKSWAEYYERANLVRAERIALEQHCLGTIAPDIPLLLAFFLLLATRSGLPQNPVERDRLNRVRQRTGRHSLLDHIEVNAPFIPYSSRQQYASEPQNRTRRERRLHAVRGHLVRRGSQVSWRIPHLRGSARWGVVQSRTVTWQFDDRWPRSAEALSAVESFAG